MAQFGFYQDTSSAPDFTKPINVGTPLTQSIDIDAGGVVTQRIWFGSDQSSQQVQDNASPGVAQITVSIVDATAGNTNPTTRFKLFKGNSPPADWNTVTAGASINLGTSVVGGAGNAVSIWVQYTGPANENSGSPITYTDLSFQTNTLRQVAFP